MIDKHVIDKQMTRDSTAKAHHAVVRGVVVRSNIRLLHAVF